ncbi:unnamed protein product [Orchesella dallaii]|uniref:Glycoside hydrolase family 65 C-terminal domain-containing protein n=1 Tax=Orchesella dallaii TaxID=48710 RepID=A0ABP1QBX1_9HEXA
MGPNDDAKYVDNNGFTNVAAAYSIFFAKYAECLCNGSMEQVPEDWVNIAKSLKLVYDSNTDYHPNFEGYQRDELTKQADSVLLGFPLLYEMNPKTRENDLNIYEKVTRKTGPGMTWAMHTIGVLELDEVERADKLFTRSYKSYIRQPFKIWTEAEPPSVSAVNYLTGMGGFLQSIFSGYGGFRLFPEKILFYKPRLPPNTTKLQFTGLSYLENIFDVIIEANKVTISLRESSHRNYLQVISGNTTYEFGLGHDKIELENGEPPITFSVSAEPSSGCPLPVDRINSIYNKQKSCSGMNSFSSYIFIGIFFIIKLV